MHHELERLWTRGTAEDLREIDRFDARALRGPRPPFLEVPAGALLRVAPGEESADEVAVLVGGVYWNAGMSTDELRRAHLGSTAWIAARDHSGRLIASARAISDTAKWAWVYDVVVVEDWRRRGVGDAVMRTLLDHPALRRVCGVWLSTRDAMRFYRRMGFVERGELPAKPWPSVDMARLSRVPWVPSLVASTPP